MPIPEQLEPVQVTPTVVRRALTAGGLNNPNLNAAGATGAGSSVYTGDKAYVLWVVRATGVTTGGTVLIQGCEKDSGTAADWYTIATVNVTASGTQYVAVLEDEWHVFMRSNVSAWTDGLYTTRWLSVPRPGVML